MRSCIKRTFRPITWSLVLAFALVLSAECVTAAEIAPAQQTCCVAIGHDCGPMIRQDCCATESHRVDQLPAVQSASAKPVLVLVAPFTVLPQGLDFSMALRQAAPDRSLQRLPDVPTYLRVSALLI